MSLESVGKRRILDDPVVIRALAHPLRLRLHALVGRDGPMTAAEAARQLGISQALASHHLRQLAQYGFVEPALAADVLEQMVAERAVAQLLDWQQRRGDWEQRWRDNTGIGQNLVYLTLDEAVELRQALDALIQPLVDRRPIGDAGARPEGAVPFDLTLIAVPLQPTPRGG